MKDGELIKGGLRWCETCCREHAYLCMCPHYPDSIKQEIREQDAAYRKNMADPEWCKQQLANGVPPEALTIVGILTHDETIL